ncbi:hypothetical protein BGZ47_007986 [Haplosporangium gracile]|nr:hypothetical protein BGZ47_007986 [Haplosporangium gracile]
MVERYSSIPPHPVLDPEEQRDHLIMDNNSNNNAPGTSLQHQQQGQQEQQQAHQPSQQQQQRKTNQKTPLRPLPPVYKIQLHLRKGEPLERRRLTHGLPDPEPYEHVQGQDSYIILRERISAHVARHPDLVWPEDGVPYIKPAESVPQKYYQQMTGENFENQMAKAWRQEAKRLPDEGLIVLNVFVYLKEREPKEPGAPGRPPSREAAAAGGAATAGAAASATGRAPGAPPGPRARLRLTDGTAATAAGSGPGAGTEVGAVRPRPLNIPGGTAPVPRPGPPLRGAGLLPPRPPGPPGTGRPGRPPLPPHLRRRPPPPGSHAAGGVGPGGGPGPIRRGPGRPPGRPPFRPPPGMQGPRVRPSAVDQGIRNRIFTPGEAVVAAINSPVITAAASSSSSSTSTLTTAAAALAGPSTSFSTSSSSSSAIPANIPPNPTLVSVPLPPLATRTQAPRAASTSARQQQQHRLSAIPQIHPPPSPPPAAPAVDQDHEMEDVGNNDHNDIDDLMQDDFDQPGLEELSPQRTYNIRSPPSPSPPPAATASSSAESSSSSIHTYSMRPHPLGPQPQYHAQTALEEQATAGGGGGGDDGDFKTINVKINGLVVPIMFDIKSLREAIFS